MLQKHAGKVASVGRSFPSAFAKHCVLWAFHCNPCRKHIPKPSQHLSLSACAGTKPVSVPKPVSVHQHLTESDLHRHLNGFLFFQHLTAFIYFTGKQWYNFFLSAIF